MNKRRSGLKPGEAYSFMATGIPPVIQPYMNAQVLREIRYMLTRNTLIPAVYLAYERRAFRHDDGLRVSFDTNVVTRRTDLRLESGVYGRPLLPDGAWLMEIKTAGTMPLWLSKLLGEYDVKPVSFSKYGTEYRSGLRPNAPKRRRDEQRQTVAVRCPSPISAGKEASLAWA